ncbi:DDE-type integrase/transposase/recombinase [Patescibacteria group bacterium]|nr:DDE-type integrase/transposase/recombinase [Patescibacteria group bacterium]
MYITMTDTRIFSISELRQLLKTTEGIRFEAHDPSEAYPWIEEVLRRYRYHRLSKKCRGVVRNYLAKVTGYSTSQLTRLISQWETTGKIVALAGSHPGFSPVYLPEDVLLLARVDRIHGRLSGAATRKILRREYTLFHHAEYVRLSRISVSHLYNLRNTPSYHTHFGPIHHTQGAHTTLGTRQIPQPNGIPGYLRVDTVHQGGDGNKGTGVYHLNLVDEVTQWEVTLSAASLHEKHVLPALKLALALFPFVIHEFHADNGSEFINQKVANLLNTLHATLSKSRPRRHNDNALVEGKNASIIRKNFGYHFIKKCGARLVQQWQLEWFIPYLNFHRPCGYATVTYAAQGKEIRQYRPDDYQTPYEKLKSLPDAASYLKPGWTFAKLDKIAYARSDTEHAERMIEAKVKLAEELTKLKEETILPT